MLMDQNINTVANWFSKDRSLTEMKEGTFNKLKIWEKEVASSYFPQSAKILDVGCGMGREAFNLYDMGYILTGVDISENAIKSAQQFASESNRNISFLLTNGTKLPFEDNTFDVIIIWSQTMGIIYDENHQLAFLEECNRVLKKKGIVSFSGHDREYLELNYQQYLKGKRFFPFADTDIYWEMFTVDEMKELAQKAGFNILECQKGKIYCEEDGTILHCECEKS